MTKNSRIFFFKKKCAAPLSWNNATTLSINRAQRYVLFFIFRAKANKKNAQPKWTARQAKTKTLLLCYTLRR